jgi:DNA-directed RNA polymerase
MLTVNAAEKEGITSIATVHDSFGCLASRAERFRRIIREQFVKLYEDHDVLQEYSVAPVRTWVRTRGACQPSRQIEACWTLRKF